MKKRNRRYLINPYIVIMSSISLIALIGGNALMLYLELVMMPTKPVRFLMTLSVSILMLVIYYINRFEYYGTVEIKEGGFIFHAPFCEKHVFLYEDMVEFGIDYCWLSVSRQFWIYFAKKPINPKHRNRINRLKCTKDYMRIQYSKKMYDRIYAAAPKDIKKKWERKQAILRRLKEEY